MGDELRRVPRVRVDVGLLEVLHQRRIRQVDLVPLLQAAQLPRQRDHLRLPHVQDPQLLAQVELRRQARERVVVQPQLLQILELAHRRAQQRDLVQAKVEARQVIHGEDAVRDLQHVEQIHVQVRALLRELVPRFEVREVVQHRDAHGLGRRRHELPSCSAGWTASHRTPPPWLYLWLVRRRRARSSCVYLRVGRPLSVLVRAGSRSCGLARSSCVLAAAVSCLYFSVWPRSVCAVAAQRPGAAVRLAKACPKWTSGLALPALFAAPHYSSG